MPMIPKSFNSRFAFLRVSGLFVRSVLSLFLFLVATLPLLSRETGGDLATRRSAELIGRAKSYIEADTLLERAVEALSIVANRYYDNPKDPAARRDAVEAMTQLAGIYSYRIFDFAQAYNYVATARMIAEEEGDDYHLAHVLSVMANLFVLSGNDDERTHAAIDSLTRLSLSHALKGNNEDVIARHAVNMSLSQVQYNDWGGYAADVAAVRKHAFSRGSVYRAIADDIFGGMDAYFAGDCAQAERLLNAAYNLVPERQYTERYRYGILYLLQYVYEKSGNYAAEEANLRKRLDMATDLHLDDYRMFTYECMRNFWQRREEPDSAYKYHVEYLLFKDSLETGAGMSKIGSMDMLRQIQKSDEEIRQLSLQRQRDHRRLVVAFAIIIVVVVVAGVLGWLFSLMRRNHRLLYARHRELLDLQDRYDRMLDFTAPESPGSSAGSEPAARPIPREELAEADAEVLRRVFARIVRFMDSSDKIYSPGFSIDELAASLHEPKRAVSNAVNYCSGGNFHQFLNTYRIRKACAMMQSESREARTVEYIAEACGFRSRTSFASLFKKSTGLTPSEYWKMSQVLTGG